MHDFVEIRRTCGGMMPTGVYERIYREAMAAPPGNFVEVGTGHGAATVCLALAVKDRGTDGRVVTLDRMEGGSRTRYGDASRNSEIAHQNFKRFGVEDVITLVVGDASSLGDHLAACGPIAVLLIDADGRIDREVAMLYDDLVADALVVIDDCNDLVKLQWTAWRSLRIASKHKLTFELFSMFVEEKLFIDPRWTHNTVFCRRAPGAHLPCDFPQKVINAYRKLVFTNAHLPGGVPGLPFLRRTPAIVRIARTPALQFVVRRITQRRKDS